VRQESQARFDRLPVVAVEHVEMVVSAKTGIPLERLHEQEKEKLLKLESRLEKRVIGQKAAVKAFQTQFAGLAPACKIRTARLAPSCFGPDRRGKDGADARLSEFLFDDDRALLRFDMSEYMEKHSVARLIGAPPGYVGYEGAGS